MNPIEKAYKAWRATVPDLVYAGMDIGLMVAAHHTANPHRKYAGTPRWTEDTSVQKMRRRQAILAARPLTPSERARHAVATYWATLTPEQRSERQRKAAKKMWKRRKAERRA